MGKNSGRIIEVIEGNYKGMTGFMYARDQKDELLKQGKVIVHVGKPDLFSAADEQSHSYDVEKIIIYAKKLKTTGFID